MANRALLLLVGLVAIILPASADTTWEMTSTTTFTDTTCNVANRAGFASTSNRAVTPHEMIIVGGVDSASGSMISSNIVCSATKTSDTVFTWGAETTTSSISQRVGAFAVYCDSKVWVLGGYNKDTTTYLNDVYVSNSSGDASTLTQKTAAATWSGRAFMAGACYPTDPDDLVMIFGGLVGGTPSNDVYFAVASATGATWMQHQYSGSNPPWDARHAHGVANIGKTLFVYGGIAAGPTFKSDLWFSENANSGGGTWVEVTPVNVLTARAGINAAFFAYGTALYSGFGASDATTAVASIHTASVGSSISTTADDWSLLSDVNSVHTTGRAMGTVFVHDSKAYAFGGVSTFTISTNALDFLAGGTAVTGVISSYLPPACATSAINGDTGYGGFNWLTTATGAFDEVLTGANRTDSKSCSVWPIIHCSSTGKWEVYTSSVCAVCTATANGIATDTGLSSSFTWNATITGNNGQYLQGTRSGYTCTTKPVVYCQASGTWSLLVAASCTQDGSSSGDPHFYGFRGQRFDVDCITGKVFNWYSDVDIQVNAYIVETVDKTGATYVGAFGLQLSDQVTIDLRVWPRFVNTIKPMRKREMPGVGVVYVIGDCGYMRWESGDLFAIYWQQYKIYIHRHRHYLPGYSFNFLDIKISTSEHTPAVHGLLGQTHWAPVISLPDDLDHRQGEGIIQGEIVDYIVHDGLLGTNTTYLAFNWSPGRYNKTNCPMYNNAAYVSAGSGEEH